MYYHAFRIIQNFPNPFNNTTLLQFVLTASMPVSVTIFDLKGEKVDVLAENRVLNKGINMIAFDASDLPSGLYFCRLEAESDILIKKMMLIR